jgi:hypothetical protein
VTTDQTKPPMARRILARLAHRARSNIAGLALSLVGVALAVGLGAFAMTRTVAIHEPPTDRADQFMQALRDKDSDQMVDAMSARFRQRLAVQRGLSAGTTLDRTLDQVAQQSMIVSYREVSSVQLKQGGSVHLFIANSKDGQGDEADVPYTVTVSPDGYVDKVE